MSVARLPGSVLLSRQNTNRKSNLQQESSLNRGKSPAKWLPSLESCRRRSLLPACAELNGLLTHGLQESDQVDVISSWVSVFNSPLGIIEVRASCICSMSSVLIRCKLAGSSMSV